MPLSADGLDFFESTIAGKLGGESAFTRQGGAPWGKNHHVRLLQDACAMARIEPAIGFHELRHTYASLLAEAGAAIYSPSRNC